MKQVMLLVIAFGLVSCTVDPPKNAEYRYRNGDLIRMTKSPMEGYENSSHGKGP